MAETGGGAGGAKLGEAFVEVVARTDKMRADLQKTRQQVQKDTAAMSQNFDRLETHVTQSVRALFGLRGTIGALIAIPLIQAAVQQTRALADSIEDIGIKSKTIGLGVEEYQKLTYAARQADVSTEELNTALGFFSKGLGQARAGVGPLVETLQRIDPALAKQIKTAGSIEEAIDIASDAINSLSDSQERAAVVTALFGRSGQGLVRLFGDGSAALRRFGVDAEKAGQVFSKIDIDKGGELSDAFTEAAAAIDTAFKKSLIDLSPVLIETIGLITKLVGHISGVTEEAKKARADAARSRVDTLSSEVQQLEERLARANEATGVSGALQRFAAGGTEQQIATRLKQIKDLEGDIIALTKERVNTSKKGDPLDVKAKEGRRLGPTEDPKERAKKLQEAEEKLRSFHEKYLQETEQFTRLAQVQQENELKGFKKLLDDKLISEGDYIQVRAELAELTAKRMAEAFEKEFKEIVESVRTVGSAIEDELVSWAETGEFNAQKMVKGILTQLFRLQLQQSVINPLFGGGDVKGGGFLGSLLAGLGGGARGPSGFTTSVVPFSTLHRGSGGGVHGFGNAGLWAGAPRLHDGLMPDEYRAVLQKGEKVLPAGTSLGGGDMIVEVNNYTGQPVQQERSRSGNVDLLRLTIGAVKEDMARGGFDGVMASRFSTGPSTRRVG